MIQYSIYKNINSDVTTGREYNFIDQNLFFYSCFVTDLSSWLLWKAAETQSDSRSPLTNRQTRSADQLKVAEAARSFSCSSNLLVLFNAELVLDEMINY